SITAHFTDDAGNQSTTAALAINLDTDNPTGQTPDLVAASDSGTSSIDNLTNDATPTIRVTLNADAVAGDHVELLLAGSPFTTPLTHTISAADVLAGYVEFTVAAGDLGADGAKSITAHFTDDAG